MRQGKKNKPKRKKISINEIFNSDMTYAELITLCKEVEKQLEDYDQEDNRGKKLIVFELCANVFLMTQFQKRNKKIEKLKKFVKTNYMKIAQIYNEKFEDLDKLS